MINYNRIVIKIGTAVLTENGELSKKRIFNIVELISKLKKIGIEVVLVSSGAVAAGYTKLNLNRDLLANRQALASIGQSYLMSIYQDKFNKFNLTISQILLTQSDFDSRNRSENAKNTINILLKNGIVPIINENDTVAIKELAFGDNDQLSAYSTKYFNADILIILSDIDGFYDKNPHIYKNVSIRKKVTKIESHELIQEASPNSKFATGGIVTKLKSADFLIKNGKSMFLSSGFDLSDCESFLIKGKHKRGTIFKSE